MITVFFLDSPLCRAPRRPPINALFTGLSTLALATAATAEPGELTVWAYTGMPAPGVAGPYEFAMSQGGARITDEGYLVLLDRLTRPNGASQRAVYVAGNGVPLTNLVDENADVAIAEFGPDDVVGLNTNALSVRLETPLFAGDDTSGDVVFRLPATLATPVLMSDGTYSTRVDLACVPFQTPEVVLRQDGTPLAAGDPYGYFEPYVESEDGSVGFVNRTHTHTGIWPVETGVVGDRLVTNGDPVESGVPIPPARSDWVIEGLFGRLVTSSGAIVFDGRIQSLSNGEISPGMVWVGTPGVGYRMLVDPEDPHATLLGLPANALDVSVSPLSVLPDGTVIVWTRFEDGSGSTRDGIWAISPTGIGTKLLLEGEHAAGLAPDERVRVVFPQPYGTHAGRAVINLDIERDGATTYTNALYTVEPDGSLVVRMREDQPQTVVIPGRPGGPFTINEMWDPQLTADGQAVFTGRISDSSGQLTDAALYTDEAGTIRPLFVAGDVLDLEPASPGGEQQFDHVRRPDVTASGHVLLRLGDRLNGDVGVVTTTTIVDPGCPADTNADGQLTPADFNAWILAFNSNADECDQNGDSACTPADFNAWILNFNTGC